MMEFRELVEARRSVRSYKKGGIDASTIRKIVETAQKAPSWKNSQTWRFYAACSDDMVRKIRETLPDFNVSSTRNASGYIIAAFEKSVSGFDTAKNEPMNECGEEWGAYDLGHASMLLLLAARECGLDTLIMGIRDSKAIRGIMNIPENQEIMSVIALGYRDAEPVMRPRKALGEVVKIY